MQRCLRLLLFFALSVAVPLHSHAFVDIESLRQQIKLGWFGESGVTLGGSAGNVNVFNGGVRSQNIYKTEESEFILLGRYTYGEASRVKNTNRGEAHMRFARDIIPRSVQWEAFTQAEFNEFQALRLRQLIGAGLRWRLYSDEQNSFYLGVGTFYEDENIEGDEDQNNLRGNVYVSFRRVVTRFAEVVAVAYYQPNYESVADYRIRLNTGIEFKLTEFMSWTNEFRYMRDTAPPAGIQRDDFFFAVSLNFKY